MLKTKKLVTLAIISLVALLQTSVLTQAKVGAPIGPDCTEMVNPYNPPPDGSYPSEGTDTTPYVHFFSESDCKAHAPYPGPHTAISDADADSIFTATAKAIADKIHGPWTDHFHIYHNNSIEDDFIYKTYIAAFEITVQSDANSNTDKTQMQCPVFAGQTEGSATYKDFLNCKDGAYDSNVFGGTKLHRTTSGSTTVLRWDFGTDDGTKKPWRPGKNPTVDKGDSPEIFPFDTSYPFSLNPPFDAKDLRSLQMGVRLRSKDGLTSKAWSGTTTSRVLVRDAVLAVSNKSNYNSSTCDKTNLAKPGNGWCAIDFTSNPEAYSASPGPYGDPVNTSAKYYWLSIGTVSTVWKKPPTEATTCDSLTLDITQNGNPVAATDVVADTPMTLKATPTFLPLSKTVPLKYTWKAGTWPWFIFMQQGQFKDDKAADPDAGNPFLDNLDDTTTYYTGGPKDTVVSVDTLYGDSSAATKCHKEFTITKPSILPKLECSSIDFSTSTIEGPDKDNSYSATVNLQDPTKPGTPLYFPTKIKWSGTNGVISPDSISHLNSSAFTSKFHTNPAVPNASLNFEVTEVTAPSYSVDLSKCKKDLSADYTTSSNKCQTLGLGSVPSNVGANTTTYLAPNPKNTTPPDPDQIIWKESGDGNLKLTSSFLTVFGCPMEINGETKSLSKNCSYNYKTDTSGSGSAKITVVPNTPDKSISPSCTQTITFSGTPSSEYLCKNLTITPSDHLDTDGETDLTATVTLSDSIMHSVDIVWSQTGMGNLTKTGTDSQNHASPFSYGNHFSTTDTNATVGVKVDKIDGKTVDNPLCKNGLTWKKPPTQCTYFNLTEKENGDVCVNTDYAGDIQWTIGKTTSTSNQLCKTPPPNTYVKAFGTTGCEDELTTGERPPQLTKGVRVNGSGSAYKKVLSITSNQKDLQYQLVFEADPSSKTSATITDTISFGSIDGKTYPTDMGDGKIEYVKDSMTVKESGLEFKECSATIKENCFTGNIGSGGVNLVKVTGPIVITYRGTVTNSAITSNMCKSGTICQEKELNNAKAKYDIYDSTDKITNSGETFSNDTVVQLFCQYILTRAAGDIYLEKDLESGIDIRRCSKYTNTPGLVITPGPAPKPGLVSTGIPSEIFTIDHEICNEGQAGTLPEVLKPLYGQDVVANLSSSICEVSLQTSKKWQKSTLVNNVKENKTRISRWEPTVPEGTDTEINTLDKNLQVYHIKGGNLTVMQPYTLSDGDGAKTFIVENGDLIINNDIKYGTCNKDLCTIRDTASLAFIVLNGSVYVDPGVKEISGVYFVQAGDQAEQGFRLNSGKLFSGAPGSTEQTSTNKLEVFGSIYGDIDSLFSNRIFAGDPTLEEAGIVIRFDERIILNTPPGLRDVLSLSQTEVAR